MRTRIVLCLAAWCSMAHAQARPLGDALTGVAKSDYDSGKVLFADGDFGGAALKFEAAYQHSHDARLLWNMAACEKSQRHYARAVRFVRQYVEQATLTAQDKSDATALLDVLEPLTVRLTVAVNQPDAEVKVDDVVIGKTPLSPAVIDLGAHKIVVHKEGFQDATKEVKLAEHEAKVDIQLTPLAVASTAPPPVANTNANTATITTIEPSHEGKVRYRFDAPGAPVNERWTVQDSGGREVCAFPCERWVGPKSGDVVVRWKGGAIDRRLAIPDGVASAPGSTVVAQPGTKTGLIVAGIVLTAVGAILIPVGIPFFAKDDTVAIGVTSMVVGVGLAVTGIVLLALPKATLDIRNTALRVSPAGIAF